MFLTWLDSNSWLIEMAGQRILLDPWLVGPLVFGNQEWLFKGSRVVDRQTPDAIDLILLSQGLEDHAHPETLRSLDRTIPVVASPNATKVVQNLHYTQVTSLAHGETITLGDRLQIRAVPGSPIGPLLTENGYVLRDLQTGESLYYEPHGFHAPLLAELAPVDVVLTPIMNLTLPLLGYVIKGAATAIEAIRLLNAQVIVPTAAGGDITFDGVLTHLLKAEGSADTLRQQLSACGLTTQVLEPNPGDRVQVETGKTPDPTPNLG